MVLEDFLLGIITGMGSSALAAGAYVLRIEHRLTRIETLLSEWNHVKEQ